MNIFKKNQKFHITVFLSTRMKKYWDMGWDLAKMVTFFDSRLCDNRWHHLLIERSHLGILIGNNHERERERGEMETHSYGIIYIYIYIIYDVIIYIYMCVYSYGNIFAISLPRSWQRCGVSVPDNSAALAAGQPSWRPAATWGRSHHQVIPWRAKEKNKDILNATLKRFSFLFDTSHDSWLKVKLLREF